MAVLINQSIYQSIYLVTQDTCCSFLSNASA